MVDERKRETELAAVRRCVQRGHPYGSEAWLDRVVKRLGLRSTICPRGRPPKAGQSFWKIDRKSVV